MTDELHVDRTARGMVRVYLKSKSDVVGEGATVDQALEDLHFKLKDPRQGRLSTHPALYYVERLLGEERE